MAIEEFDGKAALSVIKLKADSPEGTLMKRGRPELITAVRERGVDLHFVHGLKAIDLDAGTADAFSPEVDSDNNVEVHSLGTVALADYGVMRSTLTPTPKLDEFVPLINPSSLRLLGRDKNKMANEILEPLDLYRAHHLYIPGDEALRLDDIDFAQQVVAKPNTGFGSRGIITGSPQEVLDHLSKAEKPFLIEERLSFAPHLPVKGLDEKEQARIDEANASGRNKEIRMYSFGDHQWSPVGRIAYADELKMSGDEWVFLDEASVPDEAYLIASKTKDRIDQLSGTSDTLIAIGLVYVTSPSRPEPHWEVMENNFEHYIIRPDVHKETGLKFRASLADLIARKALQGREVKG